VPENVVDNCGGSVQADWTIGKLMVTSITAWRELGNLQDQDVDFTGADIVTERRNQKVNTSTHKLRIAPDFDGPLNFLLSGFCASS
jgi:hypothetical protein